MKRLITCAREGCDITAKKKTHNQKYCSDECCRLATNKKIMDKYYARRDQRKGKARWCEVCTVTKLSRYNDSLVCSSCQEKKTVRNKESVLSMLSNAQFAS